MRVGYVAPMSISAVNGGIRAQAINTIDEIKHFDVEPVLLSAWTKIEHEDIDLVHVFGATTENTGITNAIKSAGIPLVVSPVFFSTRKASLIKSAIKIEKAGAFFGGFQSEFSIKAAICHKANLLLPNTTEEALLIEKGFSVHENIIQVVPNGVEERFASADGELFKQKYGIQDFVLFAGQAGAPRKNVINLLKVAAQINAPVIIIGSFYNDDYGNKCKEMARNANNVHLIDTLEHDSNLLASAYAACKVFVLPSFYETPGIAALEAGLAGANIVITEHGGTKDYFSDFAEYVNYQSSNSILSGIQSSLKKEKSDQLKSHILKNFTWKKVAQKTAKAYKTVIS